MMTQQPQRKPMQFRLVRGNPDRLAAAAGVSLPVFKNPNGSAVVCIARRDLRRIHDGLRVVLFIQALTLLLVILHFVWHMNQ